MKATREIMAELEELRRTRRAIREGEILVEMPIEILNEVLEQLHRLSELED